MYHVEKWGRLKKTQYFLALLEIATLPKIVCKLVESSELHNQAVQLSSQTSVLICFGYVWEIKREDKTLKFKVTIYSNRWSHFISYLQAVLGQFYDIDQ